MVKTGAQRQAAYRERQKQDGLTGRINAVVSAEAKQSLESIMSRYGVTQRQALEIVLQAYGNKDLNKKEQARIWIRKYDGDFDKARETMLKKLKEDYPGFVPDGKETKRGEKYYEAQREYTAIKGHIFTLRRDAEKR